MHIIRNTVILENPSDSSHHKAKEVCVCMQHDLQYMFICSLCPPSSSSSMKLDTAKVNPTEYEQSVIAALNADASPNVETKKRQRKKAKGPNPLSVQKRKKLGVSQTPVSAGVVSKSKVSYMVPSFPSPNPAFHHLQYSSVQMKDI